MAEEREEKGKLVTLGKRKYEERGNSMLRLQLTPRESILLTVFISISIVFFLVLLHTSQVQRFINARRVSYYRKVAEAMEWKFLNDVREHDPPIGTPLEHFGNFHLINGHLNPDLPLLLIMFDSCEGCGTKSIEIWQNIVQTRSWRNLFQVMAIFQDKVNFVREAMENHKWQLPIAADPDRRLAQALNAVFTPRAYGFVEGKLMWVQKDPTEGEMAILKNFAEVVMGRDKTDKIMDQWSNELREMAWSNLPFAKER